MSTATRGAGKPYVWVTWLAKLLGGQQCVWSAWFKAHHRYQKYEEQAADLAEWNKAHTRLMSARRRELEQDGWTVFVEDANAFKLEGHAAIVAGKADLIAVKDGHVLVVDGKTGRERESDIWQVLLYLYALPKSRPDLASGAIVEGQVFYKHGDVSLTLDELTPERLQRIVDLVKAVGGDEPPPKKPSREECKRCNIGHKDCPERVGEPKAALVGEF